MAAVILILAIGTIGFAYFVPWRLVYHQNSGSGAVRESKYWGPLLYNAEIIFQPQTRLTDDGAIWQEGISQAFGPFTDGCLFIVYAGPERFYKVRILQAPSASGGQLTYEYSDGVHGWTQGASSNGVITVERVQIHWSWHRKGFVFLYSDRYWEKKPQDSYMLRFAGVLPDSSISPDERELESFHLFPRPPL